MSNNRKLTVERYEAFRPFRFTLAHLEQCRLRLGLEKSQFRVLDWGCGLGQWVLWLREQGYDAKGVDVESTSFENAIELFEQRGQVVGDHLFCMDNDGRTHFPTSSFHFIISWQVLEHVSDLNRVAEEINRLTSKGGGGFHVYPPHRRLDEGHLMMPLIHWLPKNGLRKLAIAIFVFFGIEPNWWPDKRKSMSSKIDIYYTYSIAETFYRHHHLVAAIFEQNGFDTTFVDVCENDRVHRFARNVLGARSNSKLIQLWHKNFSEALGLSVSTNHGDAKKQHPGKTGPTALDNS